MRAALAGRQAGACTLIIDSLETTAVSNVLRAAKALASAINLSCTSHLDASASSFSRSRSSSSNRSSSALGSLRRLSSGLAAVPTLQWLEVELEQQQQQHDGGEEHQRQQHLFLQQQRVEQQPQRQQEQQLWQHQHQQQSQRQQQQQQRWQRWDSPGVVAAAVRTPSASDAASGAGSAAAEGIYSAPAGASTSPPPQQVQRKLSVGALTQELRSARSCQEMAQKLLALQPLMTSRCMVAALACMGRLMQSDPQQHNLAAQRETFVAAREVFFGLVEQEGGHLSLGAATQVLMASACCQVPLSPPQQAAVEAVAVAVLPRKRAGHSLVELLASYLALGMQPGAELAPLLTPPACQPRTPRRWAPPAAGATATASATARESSAGSGGSVEVGLSLGALLELDGQAHMPAAAGTHAAPPTAFAGGGNAGPAAPAPRLLTPQALTCQLQLLQHRPGLLLRLLLHHARHLSYVHAMLGVEALAALPSRPLLAPPYLLALGALRRRTLTGLEAGAADVAPAERVRGVTRMLAASSAVDCQLSPGEQRAIEAVLVRDLPSATRKDQRRVLLAYLRRRAGLHPSSSMRAVLQVAAERLLSEATAQDLECLLPAWHERGWPVSAELAGATRRGALGLLRQVCQDQEHAREQPQRATVLAVRVMEAFVQAGEQWGPLGEELAASLRATLLLNLHTSTAALASRAMSSCRKLGLLPDAELASALMRVAGRTLPLAQPNVAASFVPRLLMVLQLQGWQYDAAPPEEQRLMQSLLGRLEEHAVQLQQHAERLHAASQAQQQQRAGCRRHAQHELHCWLGQVSHWLHLLAQVGMPPDEASLAAACSFLQQHEQQLSEKQLEQLRGALGQWAYHQHGLRRL